MQTANAMAYKEWACIAEALAQGTYVLSLRKGGIHEKKGEFSVEHREFFLFPTYLHQKENDLNEAMRPLLARANADAPPEGQVRLGCYVTVEDAVYVNDLDAAHALEGLHPFSRSCVEMRYHYKKPGLWAILQRVYRLPQSVSIADTRLYAGCRSWVPLEQELSTDGAVPALDDATFEAKAAPVLATLKG